MMKIFNSIIGSTCNSHVFQPSNCADILSYSWNLKQDSSCFEFGWFTFQKVKNWKKNCFPQQDFCLIRVFQLKTPQLPTPEPPRRSWVLLPPRASHVAGPWRGHESSWQQDVHPDPWWSSHGDQTWSGRLLCRPQPNKMVTCRSTQAGAGAGVGILSSWLETVLFGDCR